MEGAARSKAATQTFNDAVILGATGSKRFVDATLRGGAAGVAPVTYRVTAIRSIVAGLPAQFTVNFGIPPGGGAMSASVAAAPRLAA